MVTIGGNPLIAHQQPRLTAGLFRASLRDRGNVLGSFAEGGDFAADRPSFIQVGERGAERVRVEPLTGARAGQNGGGSSSPDNVSLTLNVQGGLGNLSRQEVKNLVKQAYMEVATRGNSVRRTNAVMTRWSL